MTALSTVSVNLQARPQLNFTVNVEQITKCNEIFEKFKKMHKLIRESMRGVLYLNYFTGKLLVTHRVVFYK